MSTPAIEIRGLTKSFKHFKLDGIDITVPKGAIYGLIGPNAAGKTTTIDLMLGMGREDGGTIRMFGLHHRDDEVEIKSRTGYVSPDLSYNPWKKVKRLVYFLKQYYPTWDDNYCDTLLKKFGIGWDENIITMSFGTKIKLSLAMALAHKPELLLLDEPTIGVDAVSKKEIFTELLSAVQDESRTVLISSHNLADIERFADHVGIISGGKILLEGATGDIVERYRMVDLIPVNGAVPPKVEGFHLQERMGDRWRALMDMQSDAPKLLEAKQIRVDTETPVTLEELFVGLVKECE